jgi:hypothetical protein
MAASDNTVSGERSETDSFTARIGRQKETSKARRLRPKRWLRHHCPGRLQIRSLFLNKSGKLSIEYMLFSNCMMALKLRHLSIFRTASVRFFNHRVQSRALALEHVWYPEPNLRSDRLVAEPHLGRRGGSKFGVPKNVGHRTGNLVENFIPKRRQRRKGRNVSPLLAAIYDPSTSFRTCFARDIPRYGCDFAALG